MTVDDILHDDRLRADLVNAYHLARTAGADSRHDRLTWAARQIELERGIPSIRLYKALDRILASGPVRRILATDLPLPIGHDPSHQHCDCGSEPLTCQCADPGCPVRHRAECPAQAVMHLYRVDMDDGEPVDFCEPCGDDALASGLFAVGADVGV